MLYNTKNPHGGDIYEREIDLDFSANINPFGTPDGVKAAVASCTDALSFYPDPYCRKLVSAIAEYEKVPKEYVLCGAGAAELLYAFAYSMEPRSVSELAPTFAEYTLPLRNVNINRFLLKEENGFRVTDEFIFYLEKTKPDTVFLCDPNNPTGLMADPDLILSVADKCRALDIRLVIDECFMDLADEPASFASRLAEYPGVILLKAFTKSFGMAGLRLGYCLCSDKDTLARMSRACQPWNISIPAQSAGLAALNEIAFLNKTRELIKHERIRLANALGRLGIRVFDSNVNFVLIKSVPGLAERLMEKGIKIRECSNFYGLTDEFYRIAVKLPEENDRLTAAISEVL